MKNSLFCLLVLTMAGIKAQTPVTRVIKGSISDEQHASLAYATILLKHPGDSAVYRTALSNETGAFSFNALAAGDYSIEVTMTGFGKLTRPGIKVNDTFAVTDLGVIVLKRVSKTLSGIVVTASPPFIERKIDKTVVNIAGNITSEGSTVLELMQKLPDVQVSPDGQISLNGKSGVNVYIDGRTTYLSAADLAVLLSGMSSATIQKIEIITNPSAKFDAAGTGGIINIIKKKNNKEGLNGSVNGSFVQGHYGKYNGGFTLSYQNKKYNLFFNTTWSAGKTFFNKTVTSDILNNNNTLLTEQRSDNNSISTNKGYRPTLSIDLYLSKKTILTLSGTGGTGLSTNQLISGMDILDSSLKKTNQEDFSGSTRDQYYNYTTGIRLDHQLDTTGRAFSIDLDYSGYTNSPVQKNRYTLNDAGRNFIGETDALLQQHRLLNIYAGKLDWVQPLKHNGSFEAGIKSSYVKAVNDNTYYDQSAGQNLVDSAQSNYSVNTENINAAYININSTHKKIRVEAGLRAEQTIARGRQWRTGQSLEQNYLQLFPTLFFDYNPNSRNGFIIRLGKRTERAEYAEMVPFRRPQSPILFFQGNPNLKPQLVYHIELTWSYKNTFFITVGYDVNRDYIRTLPFLDTNKVTVTRIPTNIQGAHSWNIDVGLSRKITAWWYTDNTLSLYLNAFSGQANGFNLNNNGIPSVYLNTNNSFHFNSRLSAECGFEYNSRRQLVTSTFGAYSILSVGIKRQIWNNKGTITINAHNILQDENHNAIDKYSNLYQYSYWNFYSRSVSINFTYRFGKGKIVKVHTSSGSDEEQKRAGS